MQRRDRFSEDITLGVSRQQVHIQKELNADFFLVAPNAIVPAVVAIPYDRFERLREYVDAHLSLECETVNDTLSLFAVARLAAAFDALQPGDLDPLP